MICSELLTSLKVKRAQESKHSSFLDSSACNLSYLPPNQLYLLFPSLDIVTEGLFC